LSHDDYGIYQCEATNEAGSNMNTVWVKEGAAQGSGNANLRFMNSSRD
uniref:Ig-like domain-containing protein n=1 Tax=Heligmosomoides polygyrus TaxID=6339 RepID=A0A183GWK9_HELPZ